MGGLQPLERIAEHAHRHRNRRYLSPASRQAQEPGKRLAVHVFHDEQQLTGFRNDVTNRDYATLAYRASSGETLWRAFYDQDKDGASTLAVNPDGSAVYVSGMSGADITTVAYSTS